MSSSNNGRRGIWLVGLAVLLSAETGVFAQPGWGGRGGRGDEGGRRRMGRRMRGNDGAPKAGQVAPGFKLKSLDGKKEVELAGFRGKRPVILFFGSYT